MMGKGENEHFLLFPQCFLLYLEVKTENILSVTLNFLSANASDLVWAKILLLGKVLNGMIFGYM